MPFTRIPLLLFQPFLLQRRNFRRQHILVRQGFRMPDTARTKLLTEGTLLIFLRGLDGVTAILLLVFPVLHALRPV